MAAWVFVGLALLLSGWAGPAAAAPNDSGLPVPRFVSLRAEEANIRTGPGEQYPIKWTYQRQGLPLEIVAEYHHWRRVRDWQGTEGWMHSSMLSGRRSFMVLGDGKPVSIRAEANAAARVVAQVEPKVIGRIEDCPKGGEWCRVKIDRIKGWLERKAMWGTYANEAVD
jgi:SH3-like domain-containing protein